MVACIGEDDYEAPEQAPSPAHWLAAMRTSRQLPVGALIDGAAFMTLTPESRRIASSLVCSPVSAGIAEEMYSPGSSATSECASDVGSVLESDLAAPSQRVAAAMIAEAQRELGRLGQHRSLNDVRSLYIELHSSVVETKGYAGAAGLFFKDHFDSASEDKVRVTLSCIK